MPNTPLAPPSSPVWQADPGVNSPAIPFAMSTPVLAAFSWSNWWYWISGGHSSTGTTWTEVTAAGLTPTPSRTVSSTYGIVNCTPTATGTDFEFLTGTNSNIVPAGQGIQAYITLQLSTVSTSAGVQDVNGGLALLFDSASNPQNGFLIYTSEASTGGKSPTQAYDVTFAKMVGGVITVLNTVNGFFTYTAA